MFISTSEFPHSRRLLAQAFVLIVSEKNIRRMWLVVLFLFGRLCAGADIEASYLADLLARVHEASLPTRVITHPQALQRIISSSSIDCTLRSHVSNVLQKPKWEEEEGYEYFDVVLDAKKNEPLGIAFKERGEYLFLSEIKRGGVAERIRKLVIGDELVAVNFESLVGMGLHKTVKHISTTPNPRTFRIRRKVKTAANVAQSDKRALAAAKAAKEKAQLEAELKRELEKFDFYVKIPKKGPLGISLRDNMEVSSISKGGAVSKAGKVAAGDTLISINGKSTMQPKRLDAAQAAKMIGEANFPLKLRFRPASGSNEAEIRKRLQKSLDDARASIHDEEEDDDGSPPEEANIRIVEPEIMAGKSWVGIPALFGQPFSSSGRDCGSYLLRLADDQKACKKFKRSDYNGTIVVVIRGACSFWTKARAVQKLGAVGMVVITDSKAVVEMPTGAGERPEMITIRAAMVDAESGKDILAAAATGLAKIQFSGGKNGKSLCKAGDSTADRTIKHGEDPWEYEIGKRGGKRKRLVVDNAAKLLFWSPELPPPSTESYLMFGAMFGSPLMTAVEAPAGRIEVLPLPAMACEKVTPPPENKNGYDGAIVLVNRGQCTFTTKALNVQAAGALGMILVNSMKGHGNLLTMPGDPGQETLVKIPVAMIEADDGKRLREFIEGTQFKKRESPPHNLAKITRDTKYWCNTNLGLICGVNTPPEQYSPNKVD